MHTHRPRQSYRPTTQGHLHRRDVTLPYTARDSYRYFRKRQPNARLFRSSYPKSLPSDAFIRYATEIHVMPCTRDGYGTCDNPPRTARAATNTKRLQSCHTRHKRRPRQKNRIHPSFRQSPLPARHDGIGLKSNPEASIRHRLSEEAEPEKCTEYREKHPGNLLFPRMMIQGRRNSSGLSAISGYHHSPTRKPDGRHHGRSDGCCVIRPTVMHPNCRPPRNRAPRTPNGRRA